MARLSLNHCHLFVVCKIIFAAFDVLHRIHNRTHRIAQLVRQHGQEIVAQTDSFSVHFFGSLAFMNIGNRARHPDCVAIGIKINDRPMAVPAVLSRTMEHAILKDPMDFDVAFFGIRNTGLLNLFAIIGMNQLQPRRMKRRKRVRFVT